MKIRTLAHLSDLHFGASKKLEQNAKALQDAIDRHRIDHVIVTGDVTHRGRLSELAEFGRVFGPSIRAGRITVVPGNHDRMGEDAASRIASARVWVERKPGLCVIACDSTAPHNRWALTGQGELSWDDLHAIDSALASVDGSDVLVVVALHHHVRALPIDDIFEKIGAALGWPAADELVLGHELLAVLRGRCDLVLHGHRHVSGTQLVWGNDPRPLRIYNAGSSTILGRFRVFAHHGGKRLGEPGWYTTRPAPALYTVQAGGP